MQQLESIQSKLLVQQNHLAASAASCSCGVFRPNCQQSPRASRHIELTQNADSDQLLKLSPHSEQLNRKQFTSKPQDLLLMCSADHSQSNLKDRNIKVTTQHLNDHIRDTSIHLQMNKEKSEQSSLIWKQKKPDIIMPARRTLSHPLLEPHISTPRLIDRNRSSGLLDDSEIAEEWQCKEGIAFPEFYFKP